MSETLVDAIKRQASIYDIASWAGLDLTGKDTGKPYIQINCPFHQDEKPSLSLFGAKGTYRCFGCQNGGDSINLYMKLKHLKFPEALNELADKLGIKRNIIPRKTKLVKPKAIIGLEHKVEQCHQGLLQNEFTLKKFMEKRALDLEYIKKKKIGYEPRISAFSIPIYNEKHELVNIRYHKMDSKDKWGTKNHTAKLLYDITSFNHKADYIWICEGEGDYWTMEYLLNVNAITSIGGVETLPELVQNNFKLFKDKEIWLILDNDEPGKNISAKLRLLFEETQKVFIIDWEKMQFPRGFDVSDFVIRHKKKLEDIKSISKKYTLKEAQDHIQFLEQKKVAMRERSNPIVEKDGVYIRTEGEKDKDFERISSFIIKGKSFIEVQPSAETQMPEGWLRGDIINYDGHKKENILFPPQSFISKQAFLKSINNPIFTFKGSDKDVQNITELILSQKMPRKTGITTVGFYKNYFVVPNGVIGNEGVLDESDIEYVNQGNIWDDMMEIRTEGFEDMLSKFSENVLKMNEVEIMLPILGWYIGCYYKHLIKTKLHYYPILTFFGMSGSGKSSLALQMWKLFGVTKDKHINAHSTRFTVIKALASTVNIPIIVDELRKSKDMSKDIVQFWQQIVRSSYFGEIEMRGKSDLSIVKFSYDAPLNLIGEINVINEVSTVERTIQINFDRAYRENHLEETEKAYKLLDSLPLQTFMPYFVIWMLNEDLERFDENWKKAREELFSFQIPKISSRVVDNLTVIVYGINALKRFLKFNDLDLPCDRDDMRKSLSKLIGQVFTVKGRTKNALDEFIESLGTLIKEKKLQDNTHYKREGNILWVHLLSCLPIFKKWARETQFSGEIFDDKKEYFNLSREMLGSYVTKNNVVKRFAETTHRVIEIDLLKAETMGLDISGYGLGFLDETEETFEGREKHQEPQQGELV